MQKPIEQVYDEYFRAALTGMYSHGAHRDIAGGHGEVAKHAAAAALYGLKQRAAALALVPACPQCKAQPGDPCVENGRPVDVHGPRVTAAQG